MAVLLSDSSAATATYHYAPLPGGCKIEQIGADKDHWRGARCSALQYACAPEFAGAEG
jgi:hypothetical protein